MASDLPVAVLPDNQMSGLKIFLNDLDFDIKIS